MTMATKRRPQPKKRRPSQTLGEQRVRLAFNPGERGDVHDIKKMTAVLIDYCEMLKTWGKDPRSVDLAQTAYEEAAMWAVKAATS
jgi:hypothetical protein